MDKVENWVRSLGKRKIIIIAIAIGVPVIIVILSLIMQSRSPVSGTSTPIPSGIVQQNGESSGNIQSTIPVVTVALQNGIPKWKTYEGSSYTIEVPPDWSAHPHKALGGGEVVVIKPDVIPDEINYPEFILYKSSDTSAIKPKTGLLKAIGYSESTITVLGKSASKLSGTFPTTKIVGGRKVSDPMQVTDIFLTKGGILYKFTYQYKGAKQSKVLEDFFAGLIQGISIK